MTPQGMGHDPQGMPAPGHKLLPLSQRLSYSDSPAPAKLLEELHHGVAYLLDPAHPAALAGLEHTSTRLVPAVAFPTRYAQLRQTDTSRPWAAMAQITKTSTAMMSSDQNG
jgi:hypothetical protein